MPDKRENKTQKEKRGTIEHRDFRKGCVTMGHNKEVDAIIAKLRENGYESEVERSDAAQQLFEEGKKEKNDVMMGLALYYLNQGEEEKDNPDQLFSSSVQDDVTGLLRMRPFLRLADEANRHRKEGENYVLLFYNILNFARYNYRYGLDGGDKLLKKIGCILQEVFDGCLLSHFDVDHYIVLVKETDEPDLKARLSYKRITAQLRLRNTLACKIGAYIWKDGNVSAEVGCSHAKAACDSIHDANGEYFAYYTDQLQNKNEMDEYIRGHIDEAVDKGWIQVYYQPIIRTLTGDLCSCEALSRWKDPHYGMLAPYQFIEPLEESGLIYKLDVYVLNEVCRRYAECEEKGILQVPVSFNLARQDFFAVDIYHEVEKAVQKYHVPRDYIQIEVTERVFADSDAAIETALKRFRNAGYGIWIDDFGSGYSTLNLLKDYDYDMLKIDMAFMLSNTERSRKIVQSIVQMNDRLNGASLCEGVETEEQFAFLKNIGCDFVQGYYFSAPKPFDELRQLMEKKNIRTETREDRLYYNAVNDIHFDEYRPFALFETDGSHARFLYASSAFEKEIKAGHFDSLKQMESALDDTRDILRRAGERAVRASIRRGGKTSFQYDIGSQQLLISVDVLNEKDDKRLFLAEIRNITSHDGLDDERNRALYKNLLYLADAMYEINAADDTVAQTVIVTGEEKHHVLAHGIEEDKKKYCTDWILPQDQARYLKYFNSENIMMEVRQNHKHIFRGVFRTREADGSYSWKAHDLVYAPVGDDPVFLYTITSMRREVEIIRKVEDRKNALSGMGNAYVSAEGKHFGKADILESMMGFCDFPLFLKDRDHRYVAVSRSFLDAVGLKDDQTLIGKNDQELGWCFHEDDPFAAEEEVMEKGKHIFGCERRVLLQGHVQTVSLYMMPVYIDGEIAGLLGCFASEEVQKKWKEQMRKAEKKDIISSLYNVKSFITALASYDDMYRLK